MLKNRSFLLLLLLLLLSFFLSFFFHLKSFKSGVILDGGGGGGGARGAEAGRESEREGEIIPSEETEPGGHREIVLYYTRIIRFLRVKTSVLRQT